MFQYFKTGVAAAARSAAIEAVKNVARKFAMVLQFRSKQAPVNALGTRQNALSAKISEWMDTMAPDWMKQVMPKARIGLLSAAILAGAYANKGCEELPDDIEIPEVPGWNPETGFCEVGVIPEYVTASDISSFFSDCCAAGLSSNSHRLVAIGKVGINANDSVLFDAIRKEHFACLANYISEALKGKSLKGDGRISQADMRKHPDYTINDHGRVVGGLVNEPSVQIESSSVPDSLSNVKITPLRIYDTTLQPVQHTEFMVEKD